MRVFLDANVLFTAAHNPGGKAAFVITLGSEGLFLLSTSAYAREEARRNLERKATVLLTGDHRDFGFLMNAPELANGLLIQPVADFLAALGTPE